jgi:hypothetical protein
MVASRVRRSRRIGFTRNVVCSQTVRTPGSSSSMLTAVTPPREKRNRFLNTRHETDWAMQVRVRQLVARDRPRVGHWDPEAPALQSLKCAATDKARRTATSMGLSVRCPEDFRSSRSLAIFSGDTPGPVARWELVAGCFPIRSSGNFVAP